MIQDTGCADPENDSGFRYLEPENDTGYRYLDPEKRMKVSDNTIKRIQKQAVIQYYNRLRGTTAERTNQDETKRNPDEGRKQEDHTDLRDPGRRNESPRREPDLRPSRSLKEGRFYKSTRDSLEQENADPKSFFLRSLSQVR